MPEYRDFQEVYEEKLERALEIVGVGYDPEWGWCSERGETVHDNAIEAAEAQRATVARAIKDLQEENAELRAKLGYYSEDCHHCGNALFVPDVNEPVNFCRVCWENGIDSEHLKRSGDWEGVNQCLMS